MEQKEQIQYDFCGVPRDFSQLKRLVGYGQLVEHPSARWIREYERAPSEEEQQSLRYIGYKSVYDKEMDAFSKLGEITKSILYILELPQYTEDEIKQLLTRFPCLSSYLEGHIGRGCASVDVYMNAIMSYIPEKNYYELDYVVRSAMNGLETQMPFNEQFQASRYVPYQLEVPPYPEGFVYTDARTLINKCPVEIPELVVEAVSAQAEVDLQHPLAVVFNVVDDDPQLDRPPTTRVRWDSTGTSFTDQPVGLYSDGVLVKFDRSIGVKESKDYIILQNGVMRYATNKCYVTVICDGKKIKTRDQYVMGDTMRFGIWRYEVMEKRLVCPTGGQPDFYEQVRVKMIAVSRYKAEQNRLRGFPLPVNYISWTISTSNTLYLGRLVKRNKILVKLKEGGLFKLDDYFEVFIRVFPKCVYYGDKRLLIGEHGKRIKTFETEFKRYPCHYEWFSMIGLQEEIGRM